jgi:hypothetical protein
MAELDVLGDTTLYDAAVRAAVEIIADKGHPVTRAQIAGLRQIAANEPKELITFAEHQRTRAAKRHNDSEAAFWERVKILCGEKAPKNGWCLGQLRNSEIPAELDQQARKKQREEWDREYFPVFFQHFCAEYLHKMPPEKEK